MTIETKALAETFAVLKPDLTVQTVDLGPDFYQGLDRDFNDFKGHVLMSMYEFSETWQTWQTWQTWEKHPAGDEIVTLPSGEVEFDLRISTEVKSISLTRPGDYVVVPQDTWHTARVSQPCRMLFITPGEGTQNEKSPDGTT